MNIGMYFIIKTKFNISHAIPSYAFLFHSQKKLLDEENIRWFIKPTEKRRGGVCLWYHS